MKLTTTLLVLALCCEAQVTRAAVYYVSDARGNDRNDGLSREHPWKSLARVNAHSFEPGDTIRLERNNTWHETLRLSSSGTRERPITITAFGKGARPVLSTGEINIDNNEQSYIVYEDLDLRDAHQGLRLYSWRAPVRGVTLQNSVVTTIPAVSGYISAGVYANARSGRFSDVVIRNNHFVPYSTGLENWGVYFVRGVSGFRIEDNIFGAAGEDAITIWHCSHGLVRRNSGGGNGENTIDVKDSEDIAITENLAVNDTEYNIVLHGVDARTGTRHIVVRGNHCIGGGQGGKLTAGIALVAVHDSEVIGNTVEQSAGEAILMDDAVLGSGNEIHDNLLRQNGTRRTSPDVVVQGTFPSVIR